MRFGGGRAVYRQLYFWVLLAVAAGVLVGYLFPSTGAALEPVGRSFVKLIRMVIAPIIFCTVVAGIASVRDIRQVGRVGAKALLYFEVMTTIALALGLLVMNVVRPGDGVHARPETTRIPDSVAEHVKEATATHWYDFLLHVFPDSVVGAFAEGETLQVLFFAVLFAVAVNRMGPLGQRLVRGVELVGHAMFGVIRIVMYAAPVGVFGAMAFTVGKYGTQALTSLLGLVATFYSTALFFVLVILGGVCALIGLNILRLLRYLREELLIVLGTSSTESVLPQLMRRLEELGCPRPVVGLTVPAGYSFNLEGGCIYLTLATLYLAQAQDVALSLGDQLAILGVLLLTSKGLAGVTGSGFVVLASTLSAVGTIPVAGIALIFGIDRFMSECRALTSLVGNAVATLVVSRWEGQLDVAATRRVLAGGPLEQPVGVNAG